MVEKARNTNRNSAPPVGPSGVSRPGPSAPRRRAMDWDQGYAHGFSDAMRRMSDEPDAPTSTNPHA